MTEVENVVQPKLESTLSAGSVPEILPLIPLRNVVAFPNLQPLPLAIGRQKSLLALKKALEEYDGYIVLVAQRDPEIEDPTPNDLFQVGVIAQVEHHMAPQDGVVRAIVRPKWRVKILRYVQTEPLFLVTYLVMNDIPVEVDDNVTALMRVVANKFAEYFNRMVNDMLLDGDKVFKEHENNPSLLSFLVAAYLKVDFETKQRWLEMRDAIRRLREELEFLESELYLVHLGEEIEQKVKKEIEKNQREAYLREKLKVIQQELGELGGIDATVKEYRQKIEKSGMPPEVKEKALRELSRLEKMHPFSPEAAVVRTYLEWLIDLPWDKRTEDNLDLKVAKRVLDEDHYGLEEAKDRILEYLAVKKLAPNSRAPILCFVGPPGVGKTSLAKSIARAMGRKFVRMSLGGVHDEAEIRGHRRTYVGAMPGRIIQGIRKAGTKNPVFLLDEIDKLGRDFRGDPAAALLEALDPEQNKHFVDHYLEVPFDLSEVLFITTANVTYTIPEPLLDRMDVIYLPGYIDYEKLQIAKRFLIPRLLKEMNLQKADIRITDSAILRIIREYTREAGVRNLQRNLERIFRKIVREIVESGKKQKFRIGVRDVPKYLGVPKYDFTKAEKKPEVGLVHGLAWTPYGGDIINIEATLYSGEGKLLLTGRLGDVMKESGQAALSYLKARAEEFGIEPELFKTKDIHIHIPEGAIPKDGPSAGISLATVMYSVYKNVPVPPDVAMTGEITLRGKVLPIGGLREKLLAAHRGGIKRVIIPKENVKDLEKVPDRVKRDLKIIPVSSMDEVLKEVFKGGRQ